MRDRVIVSQRGKRRLEATAHTGIFNDEAERFDPNQGGTPSVRVF